MRAVPRSSARRVTRCHRTCHRRRARRACQHLLDLGAAALAYLTELTHRRPQIWIHDVERLQEQLQTHGDAAVRRAFERRLAEQAIGAEYISHYLDTAPPATSSGPIQRELPL